MPKRFLESAVEMAKRGGAVLNSFWGRLKQVGSKEQSIDLVTEADRAAEKAILHYIEEHFPDHAFLGEETGELPKADSEYLWVVDPLDGTTNYTHQYPMVAVSIALLVKGIPAVGVVFNPILNELFTATSGGGAYFNEKKMRVSQTASLEKSLLATGFPYDRRVNPENNYAKFCHLTQISQGVRRGGSAALDLSYVAAGRLDGYWERGIKPWDVAAGILLVQEAGGEVTDYEGSPFDVYQSRIAASNGSIHEVMLQELKNCNKLFI